MSSWIAITPQHVLGRLAQSELEAYQAAGNISDDEPAPDEVDKLAEIIYQVTAMVRGKVASCARNLAHIGPPDTIPPECLFAACTIARDALVGSLPLSEGSTEVRKEELRKAHEYLEAVAKCDVMLADSAPPAASTIPDGLSAFGGKPLLSF